MRSLIIIESDQDVNNFQRFEIQFGLNYLMFQNCKNMTNMAPSLHSVNSYYIQCKEGVRYDIFVLYLGIYIFNIFSVKMMKVILKKIHWHGDLTNQQLGNHNLQSPPLMIFQKVILKSQNQTTSPTQIVNKITNRKNYRNEKNPYYGRFYHHSSQNLRRTKSKNSLWRALHFFMSKACSRV